ncbi:MAG TPA: CHAD domain-containing protein [Devosia sp.]|nr:CHAD domain-containing protein [Devosia sp.]
MSFSFSQRSRVAHQVRETAARQIEAALTDSRAGEDFDRTVHQLRRRCKKIRGLLRLVGPNFRHYDREDAAFRHAADALSASRDATVILETFQGLEKRGALQELPSEITQNLRWELEESARRVARAEDRVALLIGFGDAMVAARARVEGWSFKAKGFALIEPGLADTYERLRNQMRIAQRAGSDEAFHDWRKAAKGHWFHIALFKASAPERLGAREDQFDRLGEYLGDHHNLAVLGERLLALGGPLDERLAKVIEERKARLADKAFALGRQLTIENPAELAVQFKKFWKLLPKDT